MRWTGARDALPYISVATVIGAALYSLIAPAPHDRALDAVLGAASALEGGIVEDPEHRDTSTHLTIAADTLNGQTIDRAVRILVITASGSGFSYGDRISVRGKLEIPQPFETDSGRTFDYRHYLLASHIEYAMTSRNIQRVARGQGNAFVALLYDAKHHLDAATERILPKPESALLEGLIVGEKQGLGDRLSAAFRAAGVIHIIVLSGYNVSVIIDWIGIALARFFSRQVAYAVSAVVIIAFTVMTGASETTIRAVIMAFLMMLANVLHRPKDALRFLLIAAALMALFDPYLVLYDLSFQLSILATLGMILFSNALAARFSWVPEWKHLPLREILSTTLSTQAVVLPLLIYSVGMVSLVFLPANILILPMVPVAMFVGFFASLIALISPLLAYPFTVLAYSALHDIIAIARFFGDLPFASIDIPKNAEYWILGGIGAAYAGAFLVFLYLRRKNASRSVRRSGS